MLRVLVFQYTCTEETIHMVERLNKENKFPIVSFNLVIGNSCPKSVYVAIFQNVYFRLEDSEQSGDPFCEDVQNVIKSI